jgi:hypothetical protein
MRWDYLLRVPPSTRGQWDHEVTGVDGDAGEVFSYQWISQAHFDKIDPECPELSMNSACPGAV